MTAKWISHRDALTEPDAYFLARRGVRLLRVPRGLSLAITAESRYQLWVNGEEIGAGPSRGSVAAAYVDEIDISRSLRVGENWIAVAVHSPGRPTFTAASPFAALHIETRGWEGAEELMGVFDTDERWECHPAPEWRRRSGEYTFQIGWMEHRDLRLTLPGWATGASDDRWEDATVLPDAQIAKQLRERDTPPLTERRIDPEEVVHLADVRPADDPEPAPAEDGPGPHPIARLLASERHLPVRRPLDTSPRDRLVIPAGDVDPVLLLRFPQEVNGGLAVEFEAPAGTIMDIVYDETLVDGRAAAVVHGYSFVDRVIASGRRERITPGLHVRGFRLVQLVIRRAGAAVTLHSAHAVDRRHPLADVASFAASDTELVKIWDGCVQTLSACAVDTFVDCPWRENALYLNDLLVESRVALQLSGDGSLTAHCLRMAADQISEDGLIPAPVPYGLEPGRDLASSARHMSFPSANLFLPLIVRDHLLHTGDFALAAEMLPIIERILRACDRFLDDDGLVAPPPDIWNFVDWSFELSDASLDGRATASLSWLRVLALQATADLQGWLSDDDDAGDERRRQASSAAQRIDDALLDAHTGRYREWRAAGAPQSALAQALALLAHPATSSGARRADLADPSLLVPELFLHHFLLEAMAPSPEVVDVLRARWAPILSAGPGTIWESGVYTPGRESFDGAGSLCHGFATSPVSVLQRHVLGIRPLAPGFERVLLHPVAGDLRWAEGVVPTPLGPLRIGWKASRTDLEVTVDLPEGISAELVSGELLPSGRHHVTLPLS
ncbi:alpha-L-rhamnosidase C-terminal domain-containing protein [Microbacterium sp.]|uniref:alpha-L-rhamnosidase-related protein n=1 Tax=Microbacterium sp. TaxID=51671 RepID=UPI003342DE29